MAKNVDLKVPYSQKDAAKALGAWWSQERKCWFVPAGVLLVPFAEWLPAGDWLAHHDKAATKANKKKVAKAARKGKVRPDDLDGKVIIGPNYKPLAGATGLPWE